MTHVQNAEKSLNQHAGDLRIFSGVAVMLLFAAAHQHCKFATGFERLLQTVHDKLG
jgi:hypothetical protein